MRRRTIIGTALGLALSSPPAAAGQEAASSPPAAESAEDVVVTGEKLSPDEIRERAQDFVRKVGVVWGNKQAARWWDPVCTRVVGLAPELAREVEKRVRAVAVAADVPLAPDSKRCEANLVIAFTGDAGADLRKIALRAPRQLRDVPPETRSDLLGGKAPIRWFYHSEIRSRDGMRGLGFMPDWSAGNGEGGAGSGSVIPDNGKSVSLMQWSSGHLSTSGIRVLTGATVLIDVNLAEGATLDAVANYAALVGLSEVRLSDERPPNSILRMFSAADAPMSLTELDLAFLKSLYRIPLDRSGRVQRGAIVRDLMASQP